MTNTQTPAGLNDGVTLPVREAEGGGDREEARVVHFLTGDQLAALLRDVHPACASFSLSTEDIERMVSSFLQSGPRHPIEVLNGQLLDGRQRGYAALTLGLELPAINLCDEDLHGATPFEYALRANLAAGAGRRLKPIQIAMAAVRYQQQSLAELRLAASVRQQRGVAVCGQQKGEAIYHAASQFGVSVHTLKVAIAIMGAEDERLCQLVEQGRLSLAAGGRIAKVPPMDRSDAITREMATRQHASSARSVDAPRSPAEVADDLRREAVSFQKVIDRAEKILATNADVAFDTAPIRAALRQFEGFIERLTKQFSTRG